MSMDQPEFVNRAENKYISQLEDFFTRVWGDTNLHSHNIDHHRRVWVFAKELLTALYNEEKAAPVSADKLLIASYLHDAGMSLDSGVNHGVHSRALCSDFLSDNNLPENEFAEVLDAIEMHDNKEVDYSLSTNQVLKLLAAADDLDAFGFIGIYRYSEIYLARGVPYSDLGIRIKQNAGSRFRNFMTVFGRFSELVAKHHERYLILDEFFSGYNEEISSLNNETCSPAGKYSSLFRLFAEMTGRKIPVKHITLLHTGIGPDPFTDWYITGVLSELGNT